MTIGRSRAMALLGLRGVLIEVEADIAPGLPKFSVVGLPDRALAEATDRVRSAIVNTGLVMPAQRVTVNLSPASLPKTGSGFDFAIAMAALAAAGQVPLESVATAVHIGELSLDGRLRPTAGVLPAVMGAARAGVRTVLVPSANKAEAEMVPGISVVAVASLAHALVWHGSNIQAPETEALVVEAAPLHAVHEPDLSEVLGQRDAIEALMVAAAGGHHMFMLGPPGAGKTMLASRLPSILPDLTVDQALEVACAQSLTPGSTVQALSLRPPFEAPHHSTTIAALVGGGSGLIRPGAVARASHGVLFLDEAPEFNRATLDALRQPLESGSIVIQRSAMTATFPAKFQLVLAANPCPCGKYGVRESECECAPFTRRKYLDRLSGPLRDRIDINISVARVAPFCESDIQQHSSAQARNAVAQAREMTRERWKQFGWSTNGVVPGSTLRSSRFRLPSDTTREIDRALHAGVISMRGYDRTLRLAWTLSDLDQSSIPTQEHIAHALLLRSGAHR